MVQVRETCFPELYELFVAANPDVKEISFDESPVNPIYGFGVKQKKHFNEETGEIDFLQNRPCFDWRPANKTNTHEERIYYLAHQGLLEAAAVMVLGMEDPRAKFPLQTRKRAFLEMAAELKTASGSGSQRKERSSRTTTAKQPVFAKTDFASFYYQLPVFDWQNNIAGIYDPRIKAYRFFRLPHMPRKAVRPLFTISHNIRQHRFY